MIQSMTGFGSYEGQINNNLFKVEIKSVNSKNLDLNIRLPNKLKDKEQEIRKNISSIINRGKCDFAIYFEDVQNNYQINKELLEYYINDLQTISPNNEKIDYLKLALNLPEIVNQSVQTINENDFDEIKKVINSAIENFIEFRKTEGKVIEIDITNNIYMIINKLDDLEIYEPERIETIKIRIKKQLIDLKIEYDENRFHQELIYYIEKLDISEEKVRLRQHCNYFLETIKKDDFAGRKLGFISQEIGREINTLGSKANHSEIQKNVILMKDYLEKIKEQVLNVL